MNSWTAKIDSFQMRRTLLHGWGQLRGSGEAPSKVWLKVLRDELIVGKIPAIVGKCNQNTERDYVTVDIVLYGVLEETPSAHDVYALVLQWPDNRYIQLNVPQPRIVPVTRGVIGFMALPWRHYFSVGMRLLQHGQWRLLFGKLGGMVQAYLSSGRDPARLIQWVQAEGKPLALVIDHDLGGGANLYRYSLMDRLGTNGYSPILLYIHHGILAYQLAGKRGGRIRTANVDELSVLFDVLHVANFKFLVFNNIISFPEPLEMVVALTNWLRQKEDMDFLFLVHDHYCICPSWLLLNDIRNYCGVPDTAVCKRCLPANGAQFMEFASGIDIATWRITWGSLLREADEIRCFSNATKKLLMCAYPEIDRKIVSVVPHTLDHVQLRPVKLQDPGWPVIGVIGHIDYHKGAQVVCDLAEYIRNTEKRVRVVIIGSINIDMPKELVTITGPYRAEQLPELLERHRVNVGFFPSIWPETFSYVTEEMIVMGLPVLAFDLGAPGERVVKNSNGMVIPLSGPSTILEAIEKLYDNHVRNS